MERLLRSELELTENHYQKLTGSMLKAEGWADDCDRDLVDRRHFIRLAEGARATWLVNRSLVYT